jgi:hypothetical protein
MADDQLDDLGRGYAIMPANFSESDCRMALRNMLRGIAAMQSIAKGGAALPAEHAPPGPLATDFIRREWINTGVEEYAGAIRDDGVTHDEALRLALAAVLHMAGRECAALVADFRTSETIRLRQRVLYMAGREYAALVADFRTSETIRLRQRAELDAALRGPARPKSTRGAALPPQTGNQP